ncbi:hypothetical protein CY35_15G046500 [Sphagnum magellanicum]|nr:hypothetical protein CY35_15G046500 [Sphagnum magellanicum]
MVAMARVSLLWLMIAAGISVLGTGSWAQFSIPARYDGFVYNGAGKGKGPVIWESFVDPLCIDCKEAWPVVKEVAELYGKSLVLIVHPFPNPFHHNAFFASRALHVAESLNASLVYPLLESIFEQQDSFSNPSTFHETAASVVERLITLAGKLGLPDSFSSGFSNSDTDLATRISFKYGSSRGVVGTPTFLVNGVAVAGADESWSVDDWRKVFDPLLRTPGFVAKA